MLSAYPSGGLSKIVSAPDALDRDVPAVEYVSLSGDLWRPQRELWLALPRHPNVFEPIRETDDGLLLHYAAIVGDIRPRTNADLARLGARLARMYATLFAAVGEAQFGRLLKPLVKIDVAGEPRVIFRPVDGFTEHMAPELKKSWPRCDERAVVYAIGELVSDHIYGITPVGVAVNKCCERKPNKRFASLAEAAAAFDAIAPEPPQRTDRMAWRQLEAAMGWMEMGQTQRALALLDAMPEDNPYAAIRSTCFKIIRAAIKARTPLPVLAPLPPKPPPTPAEIINTLLRGRKLDAALVEADRFVARDSDDALFHYLRGKVLFALGRFVDAREAFERASKLKPSLLEAMMLRRETDRAIAAATRQVGTQATTIEIPDSLAPLRAVLTSGRKADAIAALSRSPYDEQPDAQLMLARFHLFDRDLAAAMRIYERVAKMPDPHRRHALVGQANVWLEEGKLDSALAVFDVVCAETPSDIDASEGRARTLELMNRDAEAAAEYRRFVSIATSRSDLRVRVAQLWLAEHA